VGSVLAIDTGRDGAAVVVSPDLQILDYLMLRNHLESAHLLAVLIEEYQPERIVVERNASAPGQSVTGAWTHGMNYGIVLGVICGGGYEYVTIDPGTWHKIVPREEHEDEQFLKWGTRLAKWYIWNSAARANPGVFENLRERKDQGLADAYWMAVADYRRNRPALFNPDSYDS